MIQEVQQAFTDTTMQHEPADFRDFYKGRVRAVCASSLRDVVYNGWFIYLLCQSGYYFW